MLSKWISHIGDEIDGKYADLPVLLMSPLSGMCDAVSFSASSVFVSMQTGNTVFLALGASYLPYGDSRLWLRAIVSSGSFWLACFLFSKLRYIGARRKIVLAFSCSSQGVLIFVSAALAQSQVASAFYTPKLGSYEKAETLQHNRSNLLILLPLAFLSFQSGGQIVMSRTSQINEIPINVLTSLYCDLSSDPNIFAKNNVKRNRRFVALVSYIGGAIGSGWLQRSSGGMPAVLWIAGGIKISISVSWLFWRSKAEIHPPSAQDEKAATDLAYYNQESDIKLSN